MPFISGVHGYRSARVVADVVVRVVKMVNINR